MPRTTPKAIAQETHADAAAAIEPMERRTTQEQLATIVEILHRMDRRDRARTYGGFVRGILGLIPMLLFLASIWYVYAHGEELLRTIASEAAKQAAGATGIEQLMEQMNGSFKVK